MSIAYKAVSPSNYFSWIKRVINFCIRKFTFKCFKKTPRRTFIVITLAVAYFGMLAMLQTLSNYIAPELPSIIPRLREINNPDFCTF